MIPDSPGTTSSATCDPRLLSLASHELRTPASVVSGYLRMVLRDQTAGLGERHRHMLEEAEKSCARISALLSEMSELARLESNTATMRCEEFDVFRAVEELAPSVLEASDRGVRLDVRGPAEGARMIGDAARIRDAFGALFRAVLREQPGPCAVAVERRLMNGRSPSIAIAHPDEVAGLWNASPVVFDEQRGGLGLTLPIARHVIERHAGRVFSVHVPRAGAAGSSAGAILVTFDLEQHL